MEVIGADHAVLNITWNGENGELPDPIAYDATDGDILAWAAEAVRGGIPGINADHNVRLEGFVVERFNATQDLPNRVAVRPKTPFGVGTMAMRMAA